MGGCGLVSDAERPGAAGYFPLLVLRRAVASCLPPRPPSITVVLFVRLPPLQVDPLGGLLALPAALVMVVAAIRAVPGNFMKHYGNVVLYGESAVLYAVATVAHGKSRRRRNRMPRTAQVDCPPSLVL